MYGDNKSENAVPPYDSATWELCCQTLANMTSLRELHMHLSGSWLDLEIHQVLRPLHGIRQTNVFGLFVGIGKDPSTVYQVDNMPFKFISLCNDTEEEWLCCR